MALSLVQIAGAGVILPIGGSSPYWALANKPSPSDYKPLTETQRRELTIIGAVIGGMFGFVVLLAFFLCLVDRIRGKWAASIKEKRKKAAFKITMCLCFGRRKGAETSDASTKDNSATPARK
jgi:hypothetical protein